MSRPGSGPKRLGLRRALRKMVYARGMGLKIVTLFAFLAASLRPTLAQPVGAGSGPLSEISRSLMDGSRPVHERGRTVSDGTVGSMKSGPVRGQRRVGMLSGPVSEISVGPVTARRPMTGGGSMTENSAGAVKHEMDPSVGEQVYDLQRTLGPLQERLRQQADAEAAAALDEAPDDSELPDEDSAEPPLDLPRLAEESTEAGDAAPDEGLPPDDAAADPDDELNNSDSIP